MRITLKNLHSVYNILFQGITLEKVNSDTVIVTYLEMHTAMMNNPFFQHKICRTIRKDNPGIKNVYFTKNKIVQNITSYGNIISIKKI